MSDRKPIIGSEVVHAPTGEHDDDHAFKKVIVEMGCHNCQHSEKDREKVAGFLHARGIAEKSDEMGRAKEGENTIAREFGWTTMLPTFDGLMICRKDDQICMPGAYCGAWAEDKGHIFIAPATTKVR